MLTPSLLKRFSWLAPAVAVACLIVVPASAQVRIQSLSVLRQVAVQAVQTAAPRGAKVTAKAIGPDARLRLMACSTTPVAAPPNLRHLVTVVPVTITCPGNAGWTVHVPVRVQMYRQVLVASQSVARGATLSSADVRAQERNVASLGYGYMTHTASVVGRRLKVPLAAGTAITPSMLVPEHAIRYGQAVSIVASVGPVQVRASGTAEGSGQPGDLISVRSTGCRCTVQGRIQQDGTIAALP